MPKYFDRVRDLIRDPFFPCNPLVALFVATTAQNRRLYDDSNYYVEVSFKGRTLSRHALPFNAANANRIGHLLDALKGDAA